MIKLFYKQTVILLVFLLFMVTAQASDSKSRESMLNRIKPMGQVRVAPSDKELAPEKITVAADMLTPTADTVAASNDAFSGPDRAKAVYEKYCVTCHAAGVAGAPKLDDAASWNERKKQGDSVLLEHVINGYKALPPKGTCMECSDDDLKAVIEYMSNGGDNQR